MNKVRAKEIGHQVEELVKNTPREVIDRMMKRLEDRRKGNYGD